MEIIVIGLVILAVGAFVYYNRSKGLDVNSDGKVDTKDLSAAVTNTVEGVKSAADVNKDGKVDTADVKVVADVNKDGKVDTADVKEVVTKTRATAKKAATKTATKVKAAAATGAKKPGRKPKTAK